MSDYVTKLRGAATVAEIDGDPFCRLKPEFVRKVADEIERLRARVAELETAVERKDNDAWVEAGKWNTLLAERDDALRRLAHPERRSE